MEKIGGSIMILDAQQFRIETSTRAVHEIGLPIVIPTNEQNLERTLHIHVVDIHK